MPLASLLPPQLTFHGKKGTAVPPRPTSRITKMEAAAGKEDRQLRRALRPSEARAAARRGDQAWSRRPQAWPRLSTSVRALTDAYVQRALLVMLVLIAVRV